MEPEFQPYGLPHLTVIFLTIVLPFVLAAIVRRTKSSLVENMIIGALSAVLVLNYVVYLIFVRSHAIVTMAADVADGVLRLGNSRCDRGDVDRKSALVRGRVFLGDWRHVASSSHAQLALWFSRLAVH